MKRLWRSFSAALSLLLLTAPAALAVDVIVQPGQLSGFTYWLTNPVVSTVLLILGIAGIVIEVATVGSFGIFGVIGAGSFILYFLGNVWAGNAGAGLIALFVAGLILLALEILVIPGFGVAGIGGVLAIVISLIMAAPNPGSAVISLLIAMVAAAVIIWFTLKNRKTRKVWSKLVLFTKQENKDGYVSADTGLAALQGQKGKALTTLRPSGTAQIDGRKVDVVTQGEFIQAGQEIEVLLVEGQRVIVRATED